MNAATFLDALGIAFTEHESARPQREAATASSWMLFMQRVLVDLATANRLHAHVGDVFDLAFSTKERSAFAPPVVTIAHDNEWTDTEVSARVYEMLVGFAPLRVAFVYPDMPPDDCAKRILMFAGDWQAPAISEDLVLIGDPRGVHFRWGEWRVLRRDPGAALRDVGLHRFGETTPPADASCLCASTRDAWDVENGKTNPRIDPATAAKIIAGCDRVSSSAVPSHHHYSESVIRDAKYLCRTCSSPWNERTFVDFPGAEPRLIFTPVPDEEPGSWPDAASCACVAPMQTHKFREYRTITVESDVEKIVEGSDVVSKGEKSVHLRCRTCEREWIHRLWYNELAYAYGARLRRFRSLHSS